MSERFKFLLSDAVPADRLYIYSPPSEDDIRRGRTVAVETPRGTVYLNPRKIGVITNIQEDE